MNRSTYFNFIEEKLNILSYRIQQRGKLNILDLNIHSETFIARLMNLLFDLNLINLNSIKQNAEAIDLIDDEKSIIIQVSSTCKKKKINDSLLKIDLEKYKGFKFMFVALAGNGKSLRKSTYSTVEIEFDPTQHIFDISSILNIIINLSIYKQKELYDLIRAELSEESDITKIDSNLTDIINILANEKLDEFSVPLEINPFEINRKIKVNDLESASLFIDDYKIYNTKINEKYDEFDMSGSNKSFSVLSLIRKQYIKLSSNNELSSSELLFKIIDDLINIVINSKNYNETSFEVLELCVSILVVDAFIRCKIFENPEGYNYVVA